MLRIGRNNNEIQTKEILDTGWEDITSVCMWIGMVEKYNFDKVEAERQIDLLTAHLGSTIDTYDKEWLDCYKKCDIINKIIETKQKVVVVLIGIRYEVGGGHLQGCHNDIVSIYNYLKKVYETKIDDLEFIVLADSTDKLCGDITNIPPTRANIIETLNKVKNNYKKFFIHYSGHGAYITDISGDEADKKDELIVPYDYKTAGIITDDQLNTVFLQQLDQKCVVRILMDCCNSGTLWDLQHKYSESAVNTNTNSPNITANVIKLSGCKDDQYSYDVFTYGKYQGAFTSCFVKNMEDNGNQLNMIDLTKNINKSLIAGGWSAQTSRLSSSFLLLDTNIFVDFTLPESGNTLLQ